MRILSSLIFALNSVSIRSGAGAAPTPKDVRSTSAMLHATPRFVNCTSAELQSLNIALEDALYLSNVAAKALNLPEDSLATGELSSLNTSTVTALAKRWFGAKVLEDSAEGLEMRSYVRTIFERSTDTLAYNPADIDYYCHPPDTPEHGAAWVGEIGDLDRGIKYKMPLWGDINFNAKVLNGTWSSSSSLNATLKDPGRDFSLTQSKRNSTFMQKDPLGLAVLHEVFHRMPVNPERSIVDVCVPGFGYFNSMFFSATVIASLDSELALRNSHNYVGFATDLAETIYSSQIPYALLETPVDWAFLRNQTSIDGVLSILPKFDTLKTVARVPPSRPQSDGARTKAGLPELDGFCNYGKWETVVAEGVNES